MLENFGANEGKAIGRPMLKKREEWMRESEGQ
jgi:hypothetical protein